MSIVGNKYLYTLVATLILKDTLFSWGLANLVYLSWRPLCSLVTLVDPKDMKGSISKPFVLCQNFVAYSLTFDVMGTGPMENDSAAASKECFEEQRRE